MSKYSEFMERQYINTGNVAKATKTFIENGVDLAFQEFHDANSVKRLKGRIMK